MNVHGVVVENAGRSADSQKGETPEVNPGVLIRRAQQLATAVWLQLTGGEMTAQQFAVLRVAHEMPGSDQTMICSRAYFDRSTGFELIARLARKGLLERVRDTVDSRRMLIYLSAEGERIFQRLTSRHDEVSLRLLEGLDDVEELELLRLLRKMVEHGEKRLAADKFFLS